MLKLGGEEEDNGTSRLRHIWTNVAIMAVTLGVVATVFTLVALYANGAKLKPHIIFILIDDLGWNDVSFHGSAQIPTPNIDALAASGIVLNNYYTHPHGTPSRGALISGKYANRLGLQHGDIRPLEPYGLPLDVVTLPRYLKDLGYSNHIIGKWHLGYHAPEYLPTRRGFETFFGNLNGRIDYYDYTVLVNENDDLNEVPPTFGVDLWENENLISNQRGKYATELYAERAVDVIHNCSGTEPLFLLLSLTACHLGNDYMPLQAPPHQVNKILHISDQRRRLYAGMVTAVDDLIGQVFDALKSKEMLSTSVVVVSSDNGGLTNGHPDAISSNWPLRGMKYFVWEGGVRSTAIVWSPILKLRKPRVFTQMMHITDWLPTFFFAAGGNLKDLSDIDGVNMWPSLLDETIASPRTEILLHIDQVRNVSALRQGDLKLIIGLNPDQENNWDGPVGDEDGNLTDSMDAWVWANSSLTKSILESSGLWLLSENDTWRQETVIICGENFMPESGKCDLSSGPCLFNITDDPCEFRNMAHLYPEVVNSMLLRISELNEKSLPPANKQADVRGDPRCLAFSYEPWLDLETEISDCPWI